MLYSASIASSRCPSRAWLPVGAASHEVTTSWAAVPKLPTSSRFAGRVVEVFRIPMRGFNLGIGIRQLLRGVDVQGNIVAWLPVGAASHEVTTSWAAVPKLPASSRFAGRVVEVFRIPMRGFNLAIGIRQLLRGVDVQSNIGAWLSPVRALGSGPRGPGFESPRPDARVSDSQKDCSNFVTVFLASKPGASSTTISLFVF